MKKSKIIFPFVLVALALTTGCSKGGKKDNSNQSGGGNESQDSETSKALEAYASASQSMQSYDGSYYLEDTISEMDDEENRSITVDTETGRMAGIDKSIERVFIPGENDLGMLYEYDSKDPTNSHKKPASNSYAVQKYDVFSQCSEMFALFKDAPLYCENDEDIDALFKIVEMMFGEEMIEDMGLVADTGEQSVEFTEKDDGRYGVDINFNYTYVPGIEGNQYPNASIEFELKFEYSSDFIFYVNCYYVMDIKMSEKNTMSGSMGEEIHIQNEFNEEFFNEEQVKCQKDSFEDGLSIDNNVSLEYKGVRIADIAFIPNDMITEEIINKRLPSNIELVAAYNDPELTDPFVESKSVLYKQTLYLKLAPKENYSILLSKFISTRSFEYTYGFNEREQEIVESLFHYSEVSTVFDAYSTSYDAPLPWYLVQGGAKIISSKLDGEDYEYANANLSNAAEHEFVMVGEFEAEYTGMSESHAARFEHMGIANNGDGILVRAFSYYSVYFTFDVKDVVKENFELKVSDYAAESLLDENGIGTSTPLYGDDLEVWFYDENGNTITEVPEEGRVTVYINYSGTASLHYVLIG